jgi:uncharacterized membrane protein YdjX (TVP38/TMEM64 family)
MVSSEKGKLSYTGSFSTTQLDAGILAGIEDKLGDVNMTATVSGSSHNGNNNVVFTSMISSIDWTQNLAPMPTELFISSLSIFPILKIICLIIGLAIIPFILQILIVTNFSPPWYAPIFSLILCAISMTISYYIGNLIGPRIIHRYLIARPHIIYQRLRGTGLLPIIFTRLFLWLPFHAINIVAGSASVKKYRFISGSIIGMLPKIIIYTALYTFFKKYILTGNLKSLTFGVLTLLMILSWFVFILNRYRFLNRAWHMDR